MAIALVLFYAPLIAVPLRSHGWSRGAGFGGGLLMGSAYMGVGAIFIAMLPPRFAKLNFTLQWLVLGLPLLGALGIVLRGLALLLWRLAH